MSSQQVVPLYCVICSKEFSGALPAQQHFISEAHRKKEDQIKNSVFQGNTRPYWCDPCNVQCNTAEQFQQHIVSPRHIETVRRSLGFAYQAATPVQNPLLSGRVQHVGSSPTQGLNQSVPFKMSSETARKEYDFKGSRGYCHLCDIDLTSPQHARQHLSGAKHQKKQKQMEAGEDNTNVLKCKICNVPFTSLGNVQEHLASAKHLKKKREMEGQDNVFNSSSPLYGVSNMSQPSNAPTRLGISPSETGTGLFADVPVYSNSSSMPETRPSQTMAPLLTTSSTLVGNMSVSDTVKTSSGDGNEYNVPYTFHGKEGYCNVCHVDFTSPQNAQQHLDGSRHKKAEKQWKLGQSASEVLKCDLCNVVFSGPESAQQHFDSDRHKKRSQLPTTNFTLQEQEKPQLSQKMTLVNNPLATPGASVQTCLPMNIKLESNSLTEPKVSQFPKAPSLAEIMLPNENKLTYSAGQTGYLPQTISNQNEGSLCLSVHGGTLTDVPILGSYSCLQNLNMVNQHVPDITDRNNSNNSSENTQMQRTPLSQENVTEEQEYIFYGSTGRCNICKIELTSREHANQHLSGKKHAKAKGLHSAGTGDVLVNNGPDVSERTGGVKPSTSPHPPYRFDGNRGWCNVCSIELTSSQHAQQHLNGKNHTNALARWQATNRHEESKESADRRLYEFNGMRGFCNVCNIELTSKAHASQHLAGKPHEKAVQRLNLVDAVDAHRDPSSGVSQPGDAMEEPAYVFTGGRGRCFVCNIELTSPQHATQHLQGRSHARAEEKRKMINQNGILSLQCKVCLKSFSGQESAAQHYASAKHISKAGLTKGSLDQVRIEAGGLYSPGRQNSVGHSPRNMYVCEVCQCHVNSFEQLSIHKKSPKHLQTVEKKQRYVAVALSAYGDENSRESSVEDSEDKTESKQGSYKDVWEALRTGEVTAVKGITPNTEVKEIISSISRSVPITTASNVSSDLVGHREHLDTDGRQSTRVSEAGSGVRKLSSTHSASKTLSTERERSPGMSAAAEETVFKDNRINTEITPSRNVISKSTTLAKLGMGRGSTIVNPTITTTDAMPLRMRTAAITQPTSTDVGDTDDFQDNVKGSGGSRRPNTHNPLKNQTTVRHRGNKVTLDVFENLDSDEEESSRSKTLPLNDDLPGGEADSLISFNTNASSILNDGPHVSMGSSTTDHNHSIAPRQDRNMSLLTDAESSICPSSNFELLSGHLGIGAIPKVPPKNPFSGYYKFYCDICNRPMNTDKDYQAHLESRAHRQRAAEVEAPRVNLGQIQRVLSIDDAEEAAYHVTNTMPRSYQVDLFCKTMEGDKVIFLPTGTGKTLVSVMTLSCMLQLNPRRPVLFLVDKVLLVLQQSKYITNELGNRKYKRMTSDGEEQERELKIATLCGNILPPDTTPLYKHDVIVSTAAYADNLLLKQQLRWEDFSLVVFDEAHHCVKNHPFNRLLEAYHRPCQPEHRPKVLGLTASPAGRDSVESTVSMLHELFHNLGGASIAIVQGGCVGELKRYQSSAKLEINYEPFSGEERAFRKALLVYICQCYLKLSELCTIDTDCQWGVERMQGEDLEDFVEHLDNAATQRFVRALGNCQAKPQQPQVKMNMDFLVNHCTVLLIVLSDLDGLGIPTAVADLQTLDQTPAQSGFQHAQRMGIPCEELQDAIRRAAHSAHVQREFDDNPLHITLYTQLLTTLTNDKYINWKAGRNAMALILVRERAHAHRLSNFLKQTQFASANSLKITSVVGHGSGQADGGMKVKQQKKVLDGVKSKKYNIIVATSVAEEGVDIPECELVVCMNPPNTVTTLVQMRGRARKKDSHFVILCKSSDEKDKIQNILQREQFMMEAAEHCVQE